MPEKSFQEHLFDRIRELSRVTMEHQVLTLALFEYLREQPSYDPARFGALYQEQRKRMNLPTTEGQDPDAVLLEMLRDFEGPIQ